MSAYLLQTPMDSAAWVSFLDSGVSEPHDRMICAIAISRSASGIITNDRQLRSLGIETIW